MSALTVLYDMTRNVFEICVVIILGLCKPDNPICSAL